MTRAKDISKILTDADISGNIDVDGVTNLDVVDIDGAVNFATDVTFADGADIITASAGTSNVRVGVNAGNALASGSFYNILVGDQAGEAITVGDYNIAIGHQALEAMTGGQTNIAIGYQALKTANVSSGEQNNVAIGYLAGNDITSGIRNTLIGSISGDVLTDADSNTALGYFALSTDTLGSNSTAIGAGALGSQNFTSATVTGNTAVGMDSGFTNTTGPHNTFIGVEAGFANQTGESSTYIGRSCGVAATGDSNTFIGRSSGSQITSGAKNTILGRFQGNSNGLDIRTASNYIVLSDGDSNPQAYYDSESWYLKSNHNGDIGLFVQNTSSANPYGIVIQFPNEANNDGGQYFLAGADSSATRFIIDNRGNIRNVNNSYGAISDVRLKEQITDASSQWNDIKALTIRKYKMKEEVSAKGDSDDLWKMGVVAQEVEAAGMNGLVDESIDRDTDMVDLGTTTKSVKYSVLYMKAVKALQEAMTRIETLEAKVATLEG